jgi:S-DNA-T family DNA segregation ATPase FtsK/SpoIIIE
VLDPPPAEPDPLSQPSMLQPLLLAGGMLGGLVFMLVNPSPLYVFAGILFLLGAGGASVGLTVQQKRRGTRRAHQAQEAYADHLAAIRETVLAAAAATHQVETRCHPAPAALLGIGLRRFERRRTDPDFLRLRVGVADRVPPRPLQRADGPSADADPVARALASELETAVAVLRGLPATVELAGVRVAVVRGESAGAAGLTRALLAQAVTWHAPADLRLAVGCAADRVADWDWVKWLPHRDGPVRTDPAELDELLAGEILSRHPATDDALPHLLVVVDGLRVDPDGAVALLGQPGLAGMTVLHLLRVGDLSPRWHDLQLTVAAGTLATPDGVVGAVGPVRVDDCEPVQAAALARRLAGAARTEEAAGNEPATPAAADLPGLLGIADLRDWNRDAGWGPRSVRDELRVPIGTTAEGRPVLLDLKEAAAGGVGPHGLVVGATGSGKSELLRTVVTGLALRHPPERLSFVLTDFKGGAAFAGLAGLPHVAGVITNLADDAALVDRAYEALHGEQQRRQELLRAAGGLASTAEYRQLAGTRPDLAPLPSLLVVVDEFSELLARHPDFADLFAAIGRLGRSLGIHLLLASQRLDEGRLRGLESHISYRIALRTFSSADSSTVLGVPDAYHLPQLPGAAYLKVGTALFQRFRAAYVSAPHRPAASTGRRRPPLLPFTATATATGVATAPAEGGTVPVGATVCDLAVRAATAEGRRTHQVWLPPLPRRVVLGGLLGPVAEHPDRGLQLAEWPAEAALAVPIGVADLPRHQRYELLLLDLAGEAGNVGVAGGPQTGKSTLLRTLALGLALTRTPDEVQLYCLDLGGALRDLAELPHTGGVVGRREPDRAARLLAQLLRAVDERERAFAEYGVESMAEARRLRAAGRLTGPGWADVVLLVDTLLDLRTELPELEPAVSELATRGLAYGVHLVVTTNRWADVRPAVRDALGSRVELRLNDPADSMLDRRSAAALPAGTPGRAIAGTGLTAQIGLPRLDPRGTGPDGEALRAVGRRARAAWPGEPAPPVRVLPALLPAAALPRPGADQHPGVPVGVGEDDLAPVYLDLTGGEPHLLVLGDAECGKTALLRVVLDGLLARTDPAQARVHVVDYRRGLLEAVPERFLAGYAAAAPAAATLVEDLADRLADRLPGPDVTAAELRGRSWWSGPEHYLVVDDYDLVDGTAGIPLAVLAALIPQARDIGLHVLVARRASGASRALFGAVLQRLRDTGSPVLLLSGDGAEGPLVAGIRPQPQPPGRGLLVRRRSGPVRIQAALPAEEQSTRTTEIPRRAPWPT